MGTKQQATDDNAEPVKLSAKARGKRRASETAIKRIRAQHEDADSEDEDRSTRASTSRRAVKKSEQERQAKEWSEQPEYDFSLSASTSERKWQKKTGSEGVQALLKRMREGLEERARSSSVQTSSSSPARRPIPSVNRVSLPSRLSAFPDASKKKHHKGGVSQVDADKAPTKLRKVRRSHERWSSSEDSDSVPVRVWTAASTSYAPPAADISTQTLPKRKKSRTTSTAPTPARKKRRRDDRDSSSDDSEPVRVASSSSGSPPVSAARNVHSVQGPPPAMRPEVPTDAGHPDLDQQPAVPKINVAGQHARPESIQSPQQNDNDRLTKKKRKKKDRKKRRKLEVPNAFVQDADRVLVPPPAGVSESRIPSTAHAPITLDTTQQQMVAAQPIGIAHTPTKHFAAPTHVPVKSHVLSSAIPEAQVEQQRDAAKLSKRMQKNEEKRKRKEKRLRKAQRLVAMHAASLEEPSQASAAYDPSVVNDDTVPEVDTAIQTTAADQSMTRESQRKRKRKNAKIAAMKVPPAGREVTQLVTAAPQEQEQTLAPVITMLSPILPKEPETHITSNVEQGTAAPPRREHLSLESASRNPTPSVVAVPSQRSLPPTRLLLFDEDSDGDPARILDNDSADHYSSFDDDDDYLTVLPVLKVSTPVVRGSAIEVDMEYQPALDDDSSDIEDDSRGANTVAVAQKESKPYTRSVTRIRLSGLEPQEPSPMPSEGFSDVDEAMPEAESADEAPMQESAGQETLIEHAALPNVAHSQLPRTSQTAFTSMQQEEAEHSDESNSSSGTDRSADPMTSATMPNEAPARKDSHDLDVPDDRFDSEPDDVSNSSILQSVPMRSVSPEQANNADSVTEALYSSMPEYSRDTDVDDVDNDGDDDGVEPQAPQIRRRPLSSAKSEISFADYLANAAASEHSGSPTDDDDNDDDDGYLQDSEEDDQKRKQRRRKPRVPLVRQSRSSSPTVLEEDAASPPQFAAVPVISVSQIPSVRATGMEVASSQIPAVQVIVYSSKSPEAENSQPEVDVAASQEESLLDTDTMTQPADTADSLDNANKVGKTNKADGADQVSDIDNVDKAGIYSESPPVNKVLAQSLSTAETIEDSEPEDPVVERVLPKHKPVDEVSDDIVENSEPEDPISERVLSQPERSESDDIVEDSERGPSPPLRSPSPSAAGETAVIVEDVAGQRNVSPVLSLPRSASAQSDASLTSDGGCSAKVSRDSLAPSVADTQSSATSTAETPGFGKRDASLEDIDALANTELPLLSAASIDSQRTLSPQRAHLMTHELAHSLSLNSQSTDSEANRLQDSSIQNSSAKQIETSPIPIVTGITSDEVSNVDDQQTAQPPPEILATVNGTDTNTRNEERVSDATNASSPPFVQNLYPTHEVMAELEQLVALAEPQSHAEPPEMQVDEIQTPSAPVSVASDTATSSGLTAPHPATPAESPAIVLAGASGESDRNMGAMGIEDSATFIEEPSVLSGDAPVVQTDEVVKPHAGESLVELPASPTEDTSAAPRASSTPPQSALEVEDGEIPQDGLLNSVRSLRTVDASPRALAIRGDDSAPNSAASSDADVATLLTQPRRPSVPLFRPAYSDEEDELASVKAESPQRSVFSPTIKQSTLRPMTTGLPLNTRAVSRMSNSPPFRPGYVLQASPEVHAGPEDHESQTLRRRSVQHNTSNTRSSAMHSPVLTRNLEVVADPMPFLPALPVKAVDAVPVLDPVKPRMRPGALRHKSLSEMSSESRERPLRRSSLLALKPKTVTLARPTALRQSSNESEESSDDDEDSDDDLLPKSLAKAKPDPLAGRKAGQTTRPKVNPLSSFSKGRK